MKVKKFFIGAATASFAIPLVATMTGCTQTAIINKNDNSTVNENEMNGRAIYIKVVNDVSGSAPLKCSVSKWTTYDLHANVYVDDPDYEIGRICKMDFGYTTDIDEKLWSQEGTITEDGKLKRCFCIPLDTRKEMLQGGYNTVTIYIASVFAKKHTLITSNKHTTLDKTELPADQESEINLSVEDPRIWKFKGSKPDEAFKMTCGNQVLESGVHYTAKFNDPNNPTNIKIKILMDFWYLPVVDSERFITIAPHIQARVDPPSAWRDIHVYFEDKALYEILEDAIPYWQGEHDVTYSLPYEIYANHKIMEDNGATWQYVGETEKTPAVIDKEANTITMSFGTSSVPKDVELHISLCNDPSDPYSSITECSWTDFYFWHNICGQDNLRDFKAIYDLDLESDSLLGLERTVDFGGILHKVRIVDTNEPLHAHYSLKKANKVDYDVLHDSDVSTHNVDFVFQFTSLLTRENSDGNNEIITSKFHKDETIDVGYNSWVHEVGPGYNIDNDKNCNIRRYLVSDEFYDKFSDGDSFLNGITPIASRRFDRVNSGDRDIYEAEWLKEKFFVATARQMGIPYEEDQKPFKYMCEGQEKDGIEVHPFPYWLDKTTTDRLIGGVDLSPSNYWTASPSDSGGGVGKVENDICINSSGEFVHVKMTHKYGILPCFCV